MFKSTKIIISALLAVVAALPAPAMAIGPSSLARDLGTHGKIEFISTTRRTVAPFAHVMFCQSNPQECTARRSRWSRLDVVLNEARYKTLRAVNTKVNQQIAPVNDNPQVAGGDVWSLNPKSGDCEDYAITKRHALVAQGWPVRALRLAVAYTAFGEGHAVLVVRTNQGDLVLDNRNSAIRLWNKTGLKLIKIEAAGNPAKWMSV